MDGDPLHQMDPYEFEKLVAEVWESYGYETTLRQQTRDKGVDIVAIQQRPFHQKHIIQVKRYGEGNSVGSREIRHYSTLYRQIPDADTIIMVTSSQFTKDAIELAKDLDIKTVDGKELSEVIEHSTFDFDVDNMEYPASKINRRLDNCPNCEGQRFKLEDNGKAAICENCGQNYKVICPSCDIRRKFKPEHGGETATCESCNQNFLISSLKR